LRLRGRRCAKSKECCGRHEGKRLGGISEHLACPLRRIAAKPPSRSFGPEAQRKSRRS
jgi:hypothetical protein